MIITELKDNEIFVFGSNLAGRHGAGAAKQALQWGAKYGQGEGLQGRTYAIPTKDHYIRTLPLSVISFKVDRFLKFAREHQEFKFLVTEIGCGLAGYKVKDIAGMFEELYPAENVLLNKAFRDYLEKSG